jgi:hypothetical protein
LNYFGVDVTGSLDASQMLYFHIDVWTPDLTAFRVKLVDFCANGVYQGGDDVEFEVRVRLHYLDGTVMIFLYRSLLV